MPNITERISLLDELRGKLNNGLIGDEFDDAVWEFVKAYDTTLRQAALDGERYRKAGEGLAKTLENLEDNPGFLDNTGWYSREEVDNALAAYRQAVEEK